jgi:PPOX class probable F420-dependent enzyme
VSSTIGWSEVVGLITGAPPAHLATATADGEPHVSTVMPGVDGDQLWLVTWRGSGKAANLRSNPRVAVMWSANSAETYVWGTAELVDDDDVRRRLWDGGILPYDPAGFFGPVDGRDSVVVRITPTRAVAKVGGDGGPRTLRWRAG